MIRVSREREKREGWKIWSRCHGLVAREKDLYLLDNQPPAGAYPGKGRTMTASSLWRDATSYAMTTDLSVEESKISQAYIAMIAARVDQEVDAMRHGMRYRSYDGQESASLARGAD